LYEIGAMDATGQRAQPNREEKEKCQRLIEEEIREITNDPPCIEGRVCPVTEEIQKRPRANDGLPRGEEPCPPGAEGDLPGSCEKGKPK